MMGLLAWAWLFTLPGLVLTALVAIPFFNVNINGEGIFLKERSRRIRICAAVLVVVLAFLLFFGVYVALPATLLLAALLVVAAAVLVVVDQVARVGGPLRVDVPARALRARRARDDLDAMDRLCGCREFPRRLSAAA